MPQLQLAQKFVPEPTARWGQFISLTDLPPMMEQAIERLRELSQLPDNWDGYGSPKITQEAKQSVMGLLACMRSYAIPSIRLDPVSGGGVQFEWEIGLRALEIEVLPDGSVEYLVAEGQNMKEDALNNPATLPLLLQWLMRC